jgi:hypothetical protein
MEIKKMSKNIDTMMDTVGRIFEATEATLAGMQDGERMQLKELASTVSAAVSLEPKYVLSFVSHFVHNTDNAHVLRGKKGGVIKGAKVVKPAKTTKTSTADAADQSADVVASV